MLRNIALCAILAALPLLAACTGGGSSSLVPSTSQTVPLPVVAVKPW